MSQVSNYKLTEILHDTWPNLYRPPHDYKPPSIWKRKMTLDLHNFFKYYDEKNPNHVAAVQWFESNLPTKYLEDSAEWAKLYRGQTGSTAPAPAGGVPVSGIKLIKEFEGCHLHAYPDPLTGGLPITIGWGSTRDKNGKPFKMGDKITQAEADELLISQCENQFLPPLTKIPYWNEMSDGKRGALLSFAYNLGAAFYGGTNFNTITKRLKNKEWNLVPDALYLYRNPGSNVEAGLARRRKAEGEAWGKG